ncbi:MAG: hypothetical protein ABJ056_06160, partial [Halioglobus sp.]
MIFVGDDSSRRILKPRRAPRPPATKTGGVVKPDTVTDPVPALPAIVPVESLGTDGLYQGGK